MNIFISTTISIITNSLSTLQLYKGPTIRKVKGGGGWGEFLPCILFFWACLLSIFVHASRACMDFFFEYICYPYFT